MICKKCANKKSVNISNKVLFNDNNLSSFYSDTKKWYCKELDKVMNKELKLLKCSKFKPKQ